jgi:FtsZ-interacting cell division protein YlmF
MSPERALRQWQPPSTPAPADRPAIKLVPDLRGEGQVRALGWNSMTSNSVFRNLDKGLDFYITELLEALTKDLESAIKHLLLEWAPNADKSLNEKALRKIANSALAPGVAGFERTTRAWQEVLDMESIVPILGQDETNSVTQYGELDHGVWLCDGCDEEIQNKTKFLIVSPLNAKHKNTLWHIQCRITYLIREEVASYRAAKSAIDKQSNSVRSIKNANEKRELNRSIQLRSRSEFHAWVDELIRNWQSSTNVKSDFWSVYESNFHEYADRILEYQLTGSFVESSITKKLAKHLGKKIVASVVKRLNEKTDKDMRFDPKVEVQILDLESLIVALQLALQSTKVSQEDLASKMDISDTSAQEILDYLEKQGILSSSDRNKSRNVIADESEISSFIKSVERINGAAPKKAEPEEQLITLKPTAYSECRQIGEYFRAGNPLIVDLSLVPENEKKRIVDFMSGLVFGFEGKLDVITSQIFLLAPGSKSETKVDNPILQELESEDLQNRVSNSDTELV